MDNCTVVYYTGNYENSILEKRIKRKLLETIGALPLISVSQKPIEFGKNICVGEVGVSSQNAWRQLQVGAKEATTEFICPAEADFIYPKEMFEFIPEREDTFYCFIPVWVLFARRGSVKVFMKKTQGSEGAIIAGRKVLIDRIEQVLSGRGMWGNSDVAQEGCEGNRLPDLLDRKIVRRESVVLKTPILSFKTNQNMHRKAPLKRGSCCIELPGIGFAQDVIREYML